MTLQKCCPRQFPFSSLSKKDAINLLTHLVVDRKHKLLYCYIPKVASSNMKRLMLTLQNMTDDSNAIKYFDQRGFEFLSDVKTSQERDRILKTFLKFIFVRHPLDRIFSAYRNKLSASGGKNIPFQIKFGRYIVQKYRKSSVPPDEVKGDDVTFEEFVKYLIDRENELQYMNEHWMPMYQLCQPCYVNYDFVGSFESLDLDISALLKKIHASRTVTFPRKQRHYGTSLNGVELSRIYTNFTADEYNSLLLRYENDFKCFSYKKYNLAKHSRG